MPSRLGSIGLNSIPVTLLLLSLTKLAVYLLESRLDIDTILSPF